MLERLSVRGLGIIDAVELELGSGFVVLSGETGAGKSLLVESLKLISGQRAQSDLVRSGEKRLTVEASFTLPSSPGLAEALAELGVDCEDELLLRREVLAAGRSRSFANDVALTAAGLQRIGTHLLAIHGQHEQYGLADGRVQRRLIDSFGLYPELEDEVRAAFQRWRSAADEHRRLLRARAQRRDRLDVISFQAAEIDALAPQPGEDEELRQRRQLLRHAVRLSELASSSLQRLTDRDGAVVEELARTGRELDEMVSCGLDLAEAVAKLAEAQVLVEDVVRDVQQLADGVSDDPAELETVEARLHGLEQLMLKYGEPVEKVIEHRRQLELERQELQGVEERVREAEEEAGAALAAYDAAAARLDRARCDAGEEMLVEVGAVLDRLNMGGTRLQWRFSVRPDPSSALRRGGEAVAFDDEGVEECELLIAPNSGEELRPMARIASGGELSRIHLAIRTALRGRRGGVGATLLFDEVDSGLGGAAAAALAGLLNELAERDQVMVVTHLPQVAARASQHLQVDKTVVGGRTVTRVKALEGSERELELARMLAGDEIGDSARAHARSLLEER